MQSNRRDSRTIDPNEDRLPPIIRHEYISMAVTSTLLLSTFVLVLLKLQLLSSGSLLAITTFLIGWSFPSSSVPSFLTECQIRTENNCLLDSYE
jgi:hypothetical protein